MRVKWMVIGWAATLACARADVPQTSEATAIASPPADGSEVPSTCDAFGPTTAAEAEASDRGARAFLSFTGTVYQATEEEGCLPWRFEARTGGVRVWLPDEESEPAIDSKAAPPCSFELEVGKNPHSLGDVADAIGPPPALIELGCTMGDMSTDGIVFARADELRSDNYWLFRTAEACRQALRDTRWIEGQPCRIRN